MIGKPAAGECVLCRGKARRGSAGLGKAGRGMVWNAARQGEAGQGTARPGMARLGTRQGVIILEGGNYETVQCSTDRSERFIDALR